ncbi:hypothetical protein [Mesorhizobium sp. M0618]|uniref:hypothetical protein n=1 Tax=unclassified Mesorhizobium TaxID=325217 RepID=UPI00333D7379
MSRRILIVVGHPDPSPDRLCRGPANAYGEGAEKAGHAVRHAAGGELFDQLETIDDCACVKPLHQVRLLEA